MKKLLFTAAIAASMISTTAAACESVRSDAGFIAKRGQVTQMIAHAHYSAHDRGVAATLVYMADRAHSAGMLVQANNYITHAQAAAELDLKQ